MQQHKMQVLGAVTILLFICINIKHVSSMVSVNASNVTLFVEEAGAINSTIIYCGVFESRDNGSSEQVLTTWTLRGFRNNSNKVLVLQNEFSDVLLIGGTPLPSIAIPTQRDQILITNFTEDFDRAVLGCGIGDVSEVVTFNFRVYRPPQLIDGVRMAIEETNVLIRIDTRFEAFPFPRDFQWTKDGVAVSNSSRIMFGYPSIHFEPISREDSGNYTLRATNYRIDNPNVEVGTGLGRIQLDILFGPDITRGPPVVGVALGEDVTLICGTMLRSNPTATVQWIDNNGVIIDPDNSRVMLKVNAAEVSLTLRNAVEEDAGNWSCIINVELVGMIQHFITLVVVGPPSEPRSITVNSTGATWAVLSWEEPLTFGFPSSAGIEYSVTATRNRDGGILTTPPVTELSMNVTGLLPSTEYSFTVAAFSVVGDSRASSGPSVMAFTTTNITVPEIECLTTPYSDDGMINVTWQFIHTGGLNLTQVSIDYSLNDDSSQFFDVTNGQLPVDGDNSLTSIIVRDLPAGNNYIFKVSSSNDIGNSSTTCPPVTHDIGIPQAPVVVQSSSSDGKVTLEVMTRESGTQPPSIFQFDVRALSADTMESKRFVFENDQYMDGSVMPLVINGFMKSEEGSVYHFNVSSKNRFGTSEESEQVSVTIDFDSGLSGAAIAGIIVAAVVVTALFIILVILIVIFCLKQKQKGGKTKKFKDPPEDIHEFTVHTPYFPDEESPGLKQEPKESPQTPRYEPTTIHRDNSDHSIYDSLANPDDKQHSTVTVTLPISQTKQSDNPLYGSTEELNTRYSLIDTTKMSSPEYALPPKSNSVPDLMDESGTMPNKATPEDENGVSGNGDATYSMGDKGASMHSMTVNSRERLLDDDKSDDDIDSSVI